MPVAIEYRDTAAGIEPSMLHGFFEGWKKPHTPERHLAILNASTHVVLAVDTEAGRVVGFVTALSDGIQAAFIPLLEVLPEYRGQGIGAALMSRMLETLHAIGCIDLTCDPELQPFYARLGMRPSHGMIIRNY